MTSFGLIGYGKIGERHATHIDAHPGATLHGVYDIKSDRLNLFRNKYRGIKTYDSLKSILADPDIDIISICTPNATHADIAIAAMKAGKHVLVEKPMAISKNKLKLLYNASGILRSDLMTHSKTPNTKNNTTG